MSRLRRLALLPVALLVIAITIILYVVWTYGGIPIRIIRGKEVTAIDVITPSLLLHPHRSLGNVATVRGKIYKHVRGDPPYLGVPQLNSIMFVTDDGAHQNGEVIHFFNLSTSEDIKVPGRGSGIGWSIIDPTAQVGDFGDYVERIDQRKVIICTRGLNWLQKA